MNNLKQFAAGNRMNCLRLILLAATAVMLNYSIAPGQEYMQHFHHLEQMQSEQMQSEQMYSEQMHSPQMQSEQMYSPQMYSPQMRSEQMYSEQMYSEQQTAAPQQSVHQEEFTFDDASLLPEHVNAGQRGDATPEQSKYMCGVDQYSRNGLEPKWRDAKLIPWENYAYGEYIGPPRTPHVPAYRLRVDDQVEFVFQVTRDHLGHAYRLCSGDTIRVTSPADERLNAATLESGTTIMPDGNIALDLVGSIRAAGKTISELKFELDALYSRFYKADPKVVVSGIQTGTRLNDFLDSIDARAGTGGLSRTVNVNPDGTIRLPLIGTVGVVGLSLDELEREVNMRYAQEIQGLRITPILTQRAPRFIYVTGEVATPGRFELSGPTSAMQAIALAGGWNNGGNLRQIVVFRRDQNWRLMAIKLDLAGGLFGKRPIPSGEIWLRDSDVVLIPKTPILRLADAVDLYFQRTLYGVFPSELGSFDALTIGGTQ